MCGGGVKVANLESVCKVVEMRLVALIHFCANNPQSDFSVHM